MSRNALAPGLLLAAPRLGDPNFERTVVLLGRHDESGALGWVINGEGLPPVRELLEGSGLVPDDVKIPAAPAFARTASRGGPVAPSSGWILYRRTDRVIPGEIEVGSAIGVTGDLTALQSWIRGDLSDDFRLLLGYAGWGPGQLEREIATGSWLPADVDVTIVFDTPSDDLWGSAYVRSIGVSPGAFMTGQGGKA